MCGRFTHYFNWAELHRLMRLTTQALAPDVEKGMSPRYNLAPTQVAPIVRQDAQGNRTVAMLMWGLVPHWAKDPGIARKLINSRSEEAAGKPSFRDAFKHRRCLIPVSDFYEWESVPGSKRKQPWAFRVKDVPLFALAGLWECWNKGGEPFETFTILTCAPNELMARYHDRMPVIVPPDQYDVWLDSRKSKPADFAEILKPFPAEQMDARKVSERVSSPANDDAGVMVA